MTKRHLLASLVLPLCLAVPRINAADLTVKLTDKEAPKEVATAIRSQLQSKAVQLLEGDKPIYEFWFCTELPLQNKPSSPVKALDSVKVTTLVGVASLPAARRDYRDDEIPKGVYTLRFGLQPQDGNHLGTAEYSWFVLLVPAKSDIRPDAFSDFKALVKASSKDTSADHPIILSLRPSATDGADAPLLTTPATDHKAVRIRIPAKAGEEKTSLSFELVYEGMGKK